MGRNSASSRCFWGAVQFSCDQCLRISIAQGHADDGLAGGVAGGYLGMDARPDGCSGVCLQKAPQRPRIQEAFPDEAPVAGGVVG